MSQSTTPLQQALLDWFYTHQRPLPWRREYIPYHIWISEIMLQQTQMERAVLFFERWMARFPDIQVLAAATEDQVLKHWEGLGYYSRARNILKCARIITSTHDGIIPDNPNLLQTLPGIGPYTAGAIASIAFNRPAPLVDANVGRIFARLFNIDMPLNKAKTKLWQIAEQLLPPGDARGFNQGLMELGALICTPKKPACATCPVAEECVACLEGLVSVRPVLQKGKDQIVIEMATGVLKRHGRIFIQQRLAEDVWGGLWEFPGGRIKEGELPEEAVVREFFEETGFTVKVDKKITTVVHYYTRYKVILHGFHCSLATGTMAGLPDPVLTAAQEFHWVDFPRLADFAFPAGHRQLIEFLKEQK